MKRRTKACLIGLAIIVLFGMAIAWGPWATSGSVCEYCGCGRWIKWRLGIKIHDEINELPVTRWVLQHNPDHMQHMWAFASSEKFTVDVRLFGHIIFCRGYSASGTGGAVGILYRIWNERGTLGEEKALTLLDRYHALLASGNRKRLHDAVRSSHMKDQPLEALLPPSVK